MLKHAATEVPTLYFKFYDDTAEEVRPSGTYKTRQALYRRTLRAISEEQRRFYLHLDTERA
jgi:hypothetical protein